MMKIDFKNKEEIKGINKLREKEKTVSGLDLNSYVFSNNYLSLHKVYY